MNARITPKRSPRIFAAALWLAAAGAAIHGDAFPARANPAAPLSADEATAVLRGDGAREAWRPHAVTLAPAKWIWLPAQRTLPNSFVLFRKEIELAAVPARAEGWIAADSRYQLSVNGQRVQWGPAPCDPRTLDAAPLDLKPFLRAGKNVIGVEVLFYGHGDGTWPGGRPGLILHLKIEAAGGSQRIVTDRSWQTLLDRAHRPGQFKRWFLRALQEFDARRHPYGWDTVDFDPDSRWVAAGEIACPPDKPASCSADWHWAGDSARRENTLPLGSR